MPIMAHTSFTIVLEPADLALIDTMSFDPLVFRGDHEAFLANAESAFTLTEHLLARNAIPEHRIRYFTDPNFNPGGRGNSRQEQFARNGTSGDDILRHPNFLKYLRYFIYGADLPPSIMEPFVRSVTACGSISSGDLAPLGAIARKLARAHNLDGGFIADEFYKLCLDLGMSSTSASSIRASVQQLRIRP